MKWTLRSRTGITPTGGRAVPRIPETLSHATARPVLPTRRTAVTEALSGSQHAFSGRCQWVRTKASLVYCPVRFVSTLRSSVRCGLSCSRRRPLPCALADDEKLRFGGSWGGARASGNRPTGLCDIRSHRHSLQVVAVQLALFDLHSRVRWPILTPQETVELGRRRSVPSAGKGC